MINAEEFVRMFGKGKSEKDSTENIVNEQEIKIRLAKVDPNYVSGRPSLIFYGETTPTVRTFLFLTSYQPKPNDKVLVLNDIILGKIGDVYEG